MEGKYEHPKDFWKEVGQMFKNTIISYPDESSYRKIGDKLRLLAYHLYVDWYSLFTDAEKEKQRRILEAERAKFIEIRTEMREKKREEYKANSKEIDMGVKGEEEKKDENGDKKEGEDKKEDGKEDNKDAKEGQEEKKDENKEEGAKAEE